MNRCNLILAIDIGGTKLAVGVAEYDEFAETGSLDAVIKEPIPKTGTPDVVVSRILELIPRLTSRASGEISTIGISIGGPLDHETGTVINFPHLPEWKDIALAGRFAKEFGVSACLDNDANLGAFAEHHWGAGKGHSSMVYLTLSTGIGGGVIIDNRLVHGVGTAAGEVGHMTVQTNGPLCPCGNRGCLERMASGANIARFARERLVAEPQSGNILRELCGNDPGRITAELVYNAVQQGDDIACSVWEEATEYIAIGLANIMHVLSPEIIVLGGGVSQAGEVLLQPIRQKVRAHGTYVPQERISIVTAALGHDSALLGAATMAMNAKQH